MTNKYEVIKNIIGLDNSFINKMDINKIRLSERSILVVQMRMQGKTYCQIGEALGVSIERARQLEKQAERNVRRYIAAEKAAAEKKAEEKAVAEKKKEQLEKVVLEKPETWEGLTIYDLDPSTRLLSCLVKWFERNYFIINTNEITIRIIIDALGDSDYPLSVRTLKNAGQKTWEELLMSLDRVMKNDDESSLYKRYSSN